MEGIFHRAMDTSDPIMSSISLQKHINRQRRLQLSFEVISMLLGPKPETLQSEESSEVDDVEDDVENVLKDVLPFDQLDLLELENDIYYTI